VARSANLGVPVPVATRGSEFRQADERVVAAGDLAGKEDGAVPFPARAHHRQISAGIGKLLSPIRSMSRNRCIATPAVLGAQRCRRARWRACTSGPIRSITAWRRSSWAEREPPVVKDGQHAPDRRSGDRLDVDPVEAAFLGAEQSGEVRVGQQAGHREQPEQVPCVVVAEQ